MSVLDFLANAVLEWILYHAIRWIEGHKLLAATVAVLLGGGLFLLLR
jgi:hypothetical protein